MRQGKLLALTRRDVDLGRHYCKLTVHSSLYNVAAKAFDMRGIR